MKVGKKSRRKELEQLTKYIIWKNYSKTYPKRIEVLLKYREYSHYYLIRINIKAIRRYVKNMMVLI
jgi:hypothetical protein